MATAINATNVIVAGGVLLIVGAGSWLLIGSVLVWALWQVVAFYVVLFLVGAAMYGLLVLALAGADGVSTRYRVLGD